MQHHQWHIKPSVLQCSLNTCYLQHSLQAKPVNISENGPFREQVSELPASQGPPSSGTVPTNVCGRALGAGSAVDGCSVSPVSAVSSSLLHAILRQEQQQLWDGH